MVSDIILHPLSFILPEEGAVMDFRSTDGQGKPVSHGGVGLGSHGAVVIRPGSRLRSSASSASSCW